MKNSLQILIAVCLVPGFLVFASNLVAQEDPFNPGGAASDEQPEERPKPITNQALEPLDTAAMITPQDDAAVRAVLSSNPQTPMELTEAIELLIKIDRDDLAKALIEQLAAITLTDQQSYELFKQAGSDVIFLIANRPGLAPTGTDFGKSLLEAADRYATDGQRISKLTDEAIRNSDKYQRSLALSDLRILGDSGAAVLIEKLVDPAYEQSWPRIRQAIGLFGDSAEGPLMAALQSNSLKLRVEALYLIGNLRSSDAVESLMMPMLSNNSTSLQREVAKRSINRMMGRVPNESECQTRLYRSAHQYLMDQVVIGRDANEDIKWWRWNAEQRKFVAAWLTARTVARIRGFQRAKDLVELNPGNEDYRRIYWVARLETAKLTAGLELPLPSVVIKSFVGTMNYQMAPQVLNLALELQRIPAAIAACEVMGAFRRQEYLASENGESPLIRALTFGSVRLKHAASNAIFKIDPYEAFPGSSDYVSSLVFLSRSNGAKTALVGHHSRESAQSIAALTSRSGFLATAATTSQQLFEKAKDDPDLQLLVITDKLSRPGFSELVQAIRATSQTSHVPILLMVNPDNLGRANRLADRFDNILVSPMVANASLIARQIENLNSGLSYEDATEVERADYSVAALEHLGHYAGKPERYPFVDLVNQQDRLIGGLQTPATAANTCIVLGELGTADAQQTLLTTASNLQLPAALRRVAVQAFKKAVERRGLMLSRQQILDQYDRYNASESESAETQQILGLLLDVIEKRSSE